jgi:alcohol dehydrogenase
MRASTIAGMSFGNADVGPVHCLSESIGGRHDLPHGLLNAVLLAPVLEFYGPAAAHRLAELGDRCGQPDLLGALRTLAADLGLPAFSGLGIDVQDFEAIARAAEANGSNSSAPRPMSSQDYFSLLNGLS